ncbi:MAG: hypothetical protein ACU84J_11025 [Gammaproteobacteria bacterium]
MKNSERRPRRTVHASMRFCKRIGIEVVLERYSSASSITDNTRFLNA